MIVVPVKYWIASWMKQARFMEWNTVPKRMILQMQQNVWLKNSKKGPQQPNKVNLVRHLVMMDPAVWLDVSPSREGTSALSKVE
jgi:hypothetical protein